MEHEQPAKEKQVTASRQFQGNLSTYKNIYRGEECIVAGLGPSLRTTPLEFLSHYHIISVNNSSQFISPNWNLVIDKLFPGQYTDQKENELVDWIVNKTSASLTFSTYSYHNGEQWVKIQLCKSSLGISNILEQDKLPSCYTSVYSAIGLAIYAGFTKIGLIGFDLTGHLLEAVAGAINEECKRYVDYSRKNGIEIYNLSANSLITVFPKATSEEFEVW